MNSLNRSLIKKAGYDNGWEVVTKESEDQVLLASALHTSQATITDAPSPSGAKWLLSLSPDSIVYELVSLGSEAKLESGFFPIVNDGELGRLLNEASRLARSLPDAPLQRYTKTVAAELAASTTSATETERLVRQRVGQNVYRESLMDYWGSACAVTGIAVPELLRASHAKPWAECRSDAERLNVFNGFLLCAHLDALFDRHLMTFTDDGEAIFAPNLTAEIRSTLGLIETIRLRWISPEHLPFLHIHQTAFREMRRNFSKD